MSIIFGVLLAAFAEMCDVELEVLTAIMVTAGAVGGVLCFMNIKRSSWATAPPRRSRHVRPLTAADFNAAWAKAKKR